MWKRNKNISNTKLEKKTMMTKPILNYWKQPIERYKNKS